jgi:hypothetical protein
MLKNEVRFPISLRLSEIASEIHILRVAIATQEYGQSDGGKMIRETKVKILPPSLCRLMSRRLAWGESFYDLHI